MTPRIGILINLTLGLLRDAESLMWCLNTADASVFPVDNYQQLENAPSQARGGRNYAAPSAGMVSEGTPLLEWLSRVDTVLVPGMLLPRTFELMKSLGIRGVFVPNLDLGWIASLRY